jgi:hypothetical protein
MCVSFFAIFSAKAQDEDNGSKKTKKNDQEALDESMLSPEQKKQMKEMGKKQKKAKKEKEAKDKITRKRATKISNARLKKSGSKTQKKKKNYIKTH